jgi:eukaryotic-like serine/threonine-protein kinase
MSLVNVGDVLVGKYRVDRVLGIGGMGMVVAATHLELDQRVALKFMLPEALLSPQATDRFLREARAAVKLRGEHVCRVLDVGKLETGSPYIVMEFLEGEDFAHVLAARGYLTVPEAVEFIMQALEGIAEAHAAGIVHRDLKPGNLFVATDSDGSPLVKVLDFGISKSAGANATKTGEVMGSPAYMAPEQMMSAKDVDARADLWAIGVILYHATAGRVPFEHDNLAGLCMAVMNDAPAPLESIAPVPPAFAAVIARCMQKQRDHRYPDVGELAAALAPFGTPEALKSAQRVAKVLRRVGMSSGSSAAIAVTMAPSGTDLPIYHPTPTPAPAPVLTRPHPSNSTIGASAGEALPVSPFPKPRPWKLIATLGAIAVVGVVAFAVARGTASSGDGPGSQPAAAPPPATTSPVETKPVETVETKPVETKPVETKPVETVETKPVETKPVETKPVETKPVETKPVETKPTTKVTTKPKTPDIKKPAGSGSAKVEIKTGSATATAGTATPPAGSASTYQGGKVKIITEYPPSTPKPAGSASTP